MREQGEQLGLRLKESGQEAVLYSQQSRWIDWASGTIWLWALKRTEFTSDDLRRQFHLHQLKGLPLMPSDDPHPNAWGAALSAAARRGEIVAVGWRRSTRPEAHGRMVRVWRGK